MTHSLIGADRRTHFKIVSVALISAIILVVVGLIARNHKTTTETAVVDVPVLKVGKPTTITTRHDSTIR